jgi:hypothetical protein
MIVRNKEFLKFIFLSLKLTQVIKRYHISCYFLKISTSYKTLPHIFVTSEGEFLRFSHRDPRLIEFLKTAVRPVQLCNDTQRQ